MREERPVAPLPSREFMRFLARAGRDRTHSAREIAAAALEEVGRELARWSNAPVGPSRASMLALARRWRRIQPAMGIFRTWGSEWAKIAGRSPAPLLGPRLRLWLAQWHRRLAAEVDRVNRTVRNSLPRGARIVTISRSGTVSASLRSLDPARRPREVVVLESQPGGEGRTLASELRGAGIKARWVRDRSRRIAVRDSDLVVIGADTVERDGSVVHKVGTRALAREALRRQVPVVVVAGSSKWVPEFSRSGPLPRLFDRTPARWIAQYWTDQGRRPGRSRIPIKTRHQRDEVPAPPRRRRRPDPGRRDGSER